MIWCVFALLPVTSSYAESSHFNFKEHATKKNNVRIKIDTTRHLQHEYPQIIRDHSVSQHDLTDKNRLHRYKPDLRDAHTETSHMDWKPKHSVPPTIVDKNINSNNDFARIPSKMSNNHYGRGQRNQNNIDYPLNALLEHATMDQSKLQKPTRSHHSIVSPKTDTKLNEFSGLMNSFHNGLTFNGRLNRVGTHSLNRIGTHSYSGSPYSDYSRKIPQTSRCQYSNSRLQRRCLAHEKLKKKKYHSSYVKEKTPLDKCIENDRGYYMSDDARQGRFRRCIEKVQGGHHPGHFRHHHKSTSFLNSTKCSEPDNITLGQVGVIVKYHEALAFYQCDQGYYGQGNMFRICSRNGSWTGSKPKCRKALDAKYTGPNSLLILLFIILYTIIIN